MAIATSSKTPVPAEFERPGPPASRLRGVVWHAFWTSRLIVLLSGTFAVLEIGIAPGTGGFDPGGLTTPFGYFGNLLAAPFARWDSVWYLTIAQGGYAHQTARTAFLPLYPGLIHTIGAVIGSDLIAGVLISLACFAAGLGVLYRLAALDLDLDVCDVVVMLLAFCPVSYFFSAVYTEALYLVLSAGCIYAARRGRWALAGIVGALAAGSRNGGIVLLLPVLIIFFYGPRADRSPPLTRWASRSRAGLRVLLPRYRVTPSVLWCALIPAGLGGYMAFVGARFGDPLAPFHAEVMWFHHTTWPFGGAWQGTVAAWDGLRQLLHGPAPPVYFTKAGGDPLVGAGENLMLFGFLVLGVIGCIGVFRTLPFAYGAYTFVSLALPLSDPVTPQPLASLPRYEAVLFPLFMWGAGLLVRKRWTTAGIATMAVLLGVFTAEFATWRFVA